MMKHRKVNVKKKIKIVPPPNPILDWPVTPIENNIIFGLIKVWK